MERYLRVNLLGLTNVEKHWSRNLVNEDAMAHWRAVAQKKKKKWR